ncbi:hypothetical protein EMIHUDRAFT_245735 [Emiliania huxleyi CCMP1516]|nr:hypothetical protein EMIHUDRAFT_245735 [Emiliania huxleyi CCMP1516]EOD15544.1 hypothetical protein EMIHUDRAFT_245735 [Emiliania huxleyi CCMP1516]|eukprot:XP_005767973.1 hypothetical protein EMIHUDRAFT_245735 [Emiliania huxleyi CCMP1516]
MTATALCQVALGGGPTPRAYHSTTRVGSALFVFGGQTYMHTSGGAESVLGDLPIFDLVRMAWETRDSRGNPPRPRYWHTATLVGGSIVIAGGYTGTRSLSDVHLLDTEAMAWSSPPLSSPLPPLACHSATLVGGRLYLFGGMAVTLDDAGASCVEQPRSRASRVEYHEDVHSIDCGEMSEAGTALRGRHGNPSSSVCAQCPEARVVGAPRPLDEVSTLDLEGLGTWHSVQVPGEAPAPVYGHSATLVGSKVVVFGGWDGSSPLNSAHVLDTTLL